MVILGYIPTRLPIFINLQSLQCHALGINQSEPIYTDHANGGPPGQTCAWVPGNRLGTWTCTGEVYACAYSYPIKGQAHLALGSFSG